MKLTIYGSRGTMPFSGKNTSRRGGNTSCTALDIDGHFIVFDCGSGLLQFYRENMDLFSNDYNLDIFLSHLHLDHIIGLSMFPPILSKEGNIQIFTRSRDDRPLAEQVFGIFRPPYWPVEFSKATKVKTIEITGEDTIDLSSSITVTPFFTELHNKTSVFKVNAEKTLVYLLDYEIKENYSRNDELIRFCTGADLVIIDASYLPEDYPSRRGWGHSTFEDGIHLANSCGCKKMIFSHISQEYSDDVLDSIENGLDATRFSFAYDGMVIKL